MRWRGPLLSTLVGLTVCSMAIAGSNDRPEEGLPPAEELLERYSSASGGAQAFAKVHTRVTRGTMSMAGAGISGTLTTWEARPDRFRMEFEAEGLGSVASGSDGETVWELSDIQGPRVLEGAERAFALRTSQLDAALRWRELYAAYETVGTTTAGEDDGVCYQVEMTPHEGNAEVWCLATNSGLPIQIETVATTAMGEIPVVIEFSDYRDVDGITVPFRTTQRLMMQEMVTQLELVENNVELADDQFALPAAIEALVATSATAASPP